MSSVAREARLPVLRPPGPPGAQPLTAALMGWFFALFTVLAAGFAAWQLGLVERPRGSGLRDWPYPEAGHGSLTANVVVWLSILVLTALLIRGLLADRMQWPVCRSSFSSQSLDSRLSSRGAYLTYRGPLAF
jgi:hypothetical protein